MRLHHVKTVSAFMALLLLTVVASSNAQWVQADGLYGGIVYSLAEYNDMILAGTSGGVFLSSDQGYSWREVNDPAMFKLKAECVGGSGPAILAAGFQGLYRSTDSGVSWTTIQEKTIFHLLVAEDSIALASDGGSILRSDDCGATWNICFQKNPMDPDFPAWLVIGPIAFCGSTVIAGSGSGVLLRSSNYGATWDIVEPGAPDSTVIRHLTVCNEIFIAYTDAKCFYSMGKNDSVWKKEGTLHDSINVMAMGAAGSTLYIATFEAGILKSEDHGQSWSALYESPNIGPLNQYIYCLLEKDGVLFAGTRFGIYRSVKGSSVMVRSDSGLAATYVNSILPTGSAVFAAAGEAGICISKDGGTTWSRRAGDMSATHLVINGNTLFAGNCSSVFRSDDAGITWTSTGSEMPEYQTNVLALVASDIGVFAGCTRGVYRSVDNGDRWEFNDEELVQGVNAMAVKGDTVYASSPRALLRFTENDHWQVIRSGNHSIRSFAADGGTILYSRIEGEVYRSTDNGRSWTMGAGEGLEGPNANLLAVGGGHCFIETDSGIFHSNDYGGRWKNVSSGLPCHEISSLAVDERNIYAGVYGHGLWRRPLQEVTGETEARETQAPPLRPGYSFRYTNTTVSTLLLSFTLSRPERVTATLFDLSGRKMASIVDAMHGEGSYEYRWDTHSVTTGCYLLKIRQGSVTHSERMYLYR